MFLFWFVADIINGQQDEFSFTSGSTISFKVLSLLFILNHIVHEAKQIV